MLSELPTPPRARCCPLSGIATSLSFVRTQVALLSPADTHSVFAAASCSSTGRSHVLLKPLPDGPVTQCPLDDTGAYVVAGTDGMAYLGTHTGRFLRFDPLQQTFTSLPSPLSDVQCTAGFYSANGRIYFGTAPHGVVVEVDPEAGSTRCFSCEHDAPRAVCAFVDLPDGRVAAFLNGERHRLLLISPDTGAVEECEPTGLIGEQPIRQVVPFDAESLLICTAPGRRLLRFSTKTLDVLSPVHPLPDDDEVYFVNRAGDALLASGVSGALYRFTDDAWKRLGVPMPNDPLLFTARPDGCLVGITYLGRLVQSTSDQCMYAVSPLPMRHADGALIETMGMAPDRKLYFSFADNMRLCRWDPEEDALDDCFVAAPFPGEVSALGFAGERLLIGFADACGVMAYYPDLPYRLLQNPRCLGLAGQQQRRPLGPMVHHESDVYFAAAAVARYCDGAIVRFCPLENELTLFDAIIPGQNLTSLIADRLSGMLLAGGCLHQYGNQPGPAQLAFWSPYDDETVRTVTPFPDATLVRVWAAEGGRIYVTDGGARLAILSSEGRVLEVGEFPLGVITSLATNQDGKLYGLAGGWMFHLDAEAQTVERLVEAEGRFLTEVRRGLYAFTNAGRVYTVQLW